MGVVAIGLLLIHTLVQEIILVICCLHENHLILLSTSMRSHRTIEFKPNSMNPRHQTLNFTVPDGRRRKPSGRKTEVVTELPIVASKNLVMGQVKILKRGEVLNDSSRILKEMNSCKDLVADQEASRRLLPAMNQKKKTEKKKGMFVRFNPKVEIAYSSTHRKERDLKNLTECFAGSVILDSPPPSSVPLPGFLKRNLLNA